MNKRNQKNRKNISATWRPNHLVRAACIASLVALGACGGGGDSGGSNAPSSSAPPQQDGSPGTGTSGTGTLTGGQLNAFQGEMLQLVNAERANGATCGTKVMPAVGALTWNTLAEASSLGHSQYMQTTETFSHTGANSSTPGQRLTAAGYVWSLVGENIAAGQPTVSGVVQAWMASAGHCENIMNGGFTELGVALVQGTASNTYGTYWTMILAAPR